MRRHFAKLAEHSDTTYDEGTYTDGSIEVTGSESIAKQAAMATLVVDVVPHTNASAAKYIAIPEEIFIAKDAALKTQNP